jgi:hypothetical protein
MVTFVRVDGVYVEATGMTVALDNDHNATVTRDGQSVRLTSEEVQAIRTLCETQNLTWVGTCAGCQRSFSHEGPGDWSHCPECDAAYQAEAAAQRG